MKCDDLQRQQDGLEVLRFTLSDAEMAEIAKLDTGKSLFFDHHDADVTRMFMGWR